MNNGKPKNFYLDEKVLGYKINCFICRNAFEVRCTAYLESENDKRFAHAVMLRHGLNDGIPKTFKEVGSVLEKKMNETTVVGIGISSSQASQVTDMSYRIIRSKILRHEKLYVLERIRHFKDSGRTAYVIEQENRRYSFVILDNHKDQSFGGLSERECEMNRETKAHTCVYGDLEWNGTEASNH